VTEEIFDPDKGLWQAKCCLTECAWKSTQPSGKLSDYTFCTSYEEMICRILASPLTPVAATIEFCGDDHLVYIVSWVALWAKRYLTAS
jgi:hypothetical protein